MALRKVKGNIERMFDKNLTDLVRGIRNNKENETKYIAQCIDEIKEELRQENMSVKANAVAKLAYLQMLGYDISWAAFNIIEVMSSTKFTYKRIGYLAASQSFHEGTDVLMLTTNMIRKDLNSQSMYDSGTAMSGLACFVTADLARDLANDVMTLLTSTKPYLRKKAVLLMYKIFLRFPDALRPAFPRLKEKLEDPDPGVQSASVNVICELARKNPKNYLSLAPVFFKLMTSSTNNWMLIKIIKLFGALTPLEPRLGKKLIEPLTNLIHSTSAMSLLYECINTVIAGMPNHSASIQLCVQKLRILIEDSDQNLKYLGLLAMSKILKTHPRSVQAHKDLVLQCLDDKDESIRLRALDLLYGMVSKKNLMEIVKKLMVHMDRAEGTGYRDELLSKIIDICSQNNYQFITNFEWYVSVLVELTRIEGTKHGLTIASQMLDVAVRVQAVRAFSVSQMAVLLDNTHLLMGNGQRNSICEVLYAAAWICGEYSELLLEPQSTLEALLRPRASQLPPHIQSAYVHNALKLWARLVAAQEEHEDPDCSQLLSERLPLFVQSGDLEVQERACCALNLVKQVSKMHARGERVGDELQALFAGELNPVAPKAQKKVPLPEGLDLDQWINDPPSESSSEEEENTTEIFIKSERSAAMSHFSEKKYEPTKEELENMREVRRQEQASNPHYLKAMPKSRSANGHLQAAALDDIPVTEIDLSVPLHIPGLISSDKYLNASRKERDVADGGKKKKKKLKKGKERRKKTSQLAVASESDEEELPGPLGVVNTSVEMPEGARLTDDDDDDRNADDPHRALDIDLEEPLHEEERLPSQAQYESLSAGSAKHAAEPEGKPSRKHKEKKHRKKGHKEHRKGQLLPEASHGSESPAEEASSHVKDELDFWLSPAESQDRPAGGDASRDSMLPSTSVAEVNGAAPVSKSERSGRKKHHESEASGSKVEKKKKKAKSSKGTATLLQQDMPKDKREYEETPGITTPSKEPGFSAAQTPMTPSMPQPASNYKPLAEDKNIKLTYEVRTLPMVRDQVVVSVIFTNQSPFQLKEMELNILDTLNTKMLRGVGPHEGVRVPFQLPEGTANEGQFAFSVDSVSMAQRLRGTLTYMLITENGSTHEKLDFKLHLPVSSYLMGTMSKRDTFAELLSGGELSAKSSITLDAVEYEFPHVLSKLCFHCHFTVVEQVGLSASLYSRSIQDDHICLLIKHMNPSRVLVDGKSTNSQLLSSLLDEVRSLLSASTMTST
ncbi:AP-3 complex subunit delta-1-like isoform X2 [Dermacentor silvarum]|uniref:AP-3 complex subunit delta-1-like isoform X2 n=1 Tax=Dermacentor silvarum TaxID=543639 RepID=UPI002100FD32|nr:AP-3 complex subunit delta-1-like isoform X2 [Dermacentor silvarum]